MELSGLDRELAGKLAVLARALAKSEGQVGEGEVGEGEQVRYSSMSELCPS
jgi:hypothetical protein